MASAGNGAPDGRQAERGCDGSADDEEEEESKRAQWFGAAGLSWRRLARGVLLFTCSNAIFWFVALSSWRVYYLITLAFLALVMVQIVKEFALSRARGAQLWRSLSKSWEVIDTKQESRSGEMHILSEFWKSCSLFFQEMSSFKHQNPGKFCLLVCSLCTFCAILGRYIPGIIISYVALLCAFLWPIISSQEFSRALHSKMEPIIQKLDFGIFQKSSKTQEKQHLGFIDDNSEADISAFCPMLNPLTSGKELSVSDTEVSEPSWTDNGTFNLSEGHTPQTENSDDLDRPSDTDEVFTCGLSEFPSLENGAGTNGDDDELSIGFPASPVQPVNYRQQLSSTIKEQFSLSLTGGHTVDLVSTMAEKVIVTAVTAAINEQLQGLQSEQPSRPPHPGDLFGDDSDSEDADDFELLDQSELEQAESDMGLTQGQKKSEEDNKKAKSSGFLSSLLGGH
ncbi:reticulophagy regulator 1 [Polypterus senegalus]|uniref:reticulophagy regulator 1 n=1 Tax=Polypterus senegalus TaxID=55291 RepID=UPI001963C283|nr:reticulophagy regulator 1 [Polypterus senegalus]